MVTPKTFTEFFQDRYKNVKYPVITLPITLVRWIGLENVLDEDIKYYKKISSKNRRVTDHC